MKIKRQEVWNNPKNIAGKEDLKCRTMFKNWI